MKGNRWFNIVFSHPEDCWCVYPTLETTDLGHFALFKKAKGKRNSLLRKERESAEEGSRFRGMGKGLGHSFTVDI